MKKKPVLLIITLMLVISCKKNTQNMKKDIPEPTVAKKPTQLEKHGDVRIDNYYWLNDRENPEVIAYLEAENAYNDTITAHTKDFQKDLFEELKESRERWCDWTILRFCRARKFNVVKIKEMIKKNVDFMNKINLERLS